MRRSVSFAALFFLSAPILYVFWMIFVGTFEKWELLVGIAAATVGSVALCVVEHAESSHFRPRLRDLAQIVFVPWLFLQGTYEILLVAFRDLLGGRKAVSAFRVASFNCGTLRDPCDTGRRVLAVTYTTMAPNFVVLGINAREKQMLFHQIERGGIPRMTQNLGAAG